MGPTSGRISDGSPDVYINGRHAARVADPETCDAGKVAQGSSSVSVNGRPAARVGDKVTCGAVIIEGSSNVFIGGAQTIKMPVQSEVPEWARWTAAVITILPALGGLARAVGPAIAEVQATGLSRALQSGVKALGQTMEDRAGGAADGIRSPGGEPPIPPGGKQAITKCDPERPAGKVDMKNLSAGDQEAADTMAAGGWNTKTQQTVLDSGDGFSVTQGKAGDPMYKFSSAGRDEDAINTSTPSAFYTDQAGFDSLKSSHYDENTDTWNSQGVKNELALPCYNAADTVWQGTLNADQPLVNSQIGSVTESVTNTDASGAVTDTFSRPMTGGGSQITPSSGGVANLKTFSPRRTGP